MFKNLRAHKEEGFTLIELLITVVILAVIMGIAIPIYVNNKKSADSAAAKSEVHEVAVAISGGIGTGDLATSDNTGAAALTGVITYQGASQSVGGTTAFVNTSNGKFSVSESDGGTHFWKATQAASVFLDTTASVAADVA